MEIAADESPKQRLTRLVRQYQTDLLRICYIQLHDTALAEDAVQETYLKAYRSMPAFRGDCSEKTWLMRIAVNVCRDMLRSAWFRHLDRRITLEQLPEPIAKRRGLLSDGGGHAASAEIPRSRPSVLLRSHDDR